MVEIRKPIKVNEAIAKTLSFAKIGKVQHVPIEKSYGLFLGEDIIATHDIPYFNRSPYDGFAIRSADTLEATADCPIEFEVIGHIGAGNVFFGSVGKNQAVRIMTGAEVPADCDAIIMLELVTEVTNNDKPMIQIKRKVKRGENISFIGEDTKAGTVLVKKGSIINPGVVAVLATFGYKTVPVSVKPTIGILTTGSELLAIEDPLVQGKIRNSNAYMIFSQVMRAGGEPVYLGQVTDDLETSFRQIDAALDSVDYLITTGGVSVGDFDYLPAIYEKLSAQVLFNKVGMRPGSVTTVAEKDGKLLFGLSGNPSACYVGFELFTRPVIRTWLQCEYPLLQKVTATLSTDFPKANPFDRFVRGHLSYTNGQLSASPIGLDKSNVVTSLAGANILIVLPRGTRGFAKGDTVQVILLEDQEGMRSWEV